MDKMEFRYGDGSLCFSYNELSNNLNEKYASKMCLRKYEWFSSNISLDNEYFIERGLIKASLLCIWMFFLKWKGHVSTWNMLMICKRNMLFIKGFLKNSVIKYSFYKRSKWIKILIDLYDWKRNRWRINLWFGIKWRKICFNNEFQSSHWLMDIQDHK